MVEARRRAVTAGEAARLRREADLRELEGLRAQLAQAEARQERHRWRQQHEEKTPSAQDRLRLPKDALERAQDLALSLRVEVETLRLMAGVGGGEAGEGQKEGAVEAEAATAATAAGASTSRAVREAQEEVRLRASPARRYCCRAVDMRVLPNGSRRVYIRAPGFGVVVCFHNK